MVQTKLEQIKGDQSLILQAENGITEYSHLWIHFVSAPRGKEQIQGETKCFEM